MAIIIISSFIGIGFTLANLFILSIMVKLYTEILKDKSITKRIGEKKE